MTQGNDNSLETFLNFRDSVGCRTLMAGSREHPFSSSFKNVGPGLRVREKGFIQQWLVEASSVPSTVLGTGDTAMNKTVKRLPSRSSHPSGGSKNKIKSCPKQT